VKMVGLKVPIDGRFRLGKGRGLCQLGFIPSERRP
jgi:hypothetical protein